MADMIRPEDIRRIISDSDRRQPGQRREPEPLTRRTAVDRPGLDEGTFHDREPPLEAFDEKEPARGGGWIEPPSAPSPEPEPPFDEPEFEEEAPVAASDQGYDGPPLGIPGEPEEPVLTEESAAERPRRRLLFPLLIALIALLGFGLVLLYGFQGEGPGPGPEAPTLQAQVEVDKVKPSEPGGLQVPNRDVQVLDQSASRSEPAAVVLQPPPEEPAPLPPVPQPLEAAPETDSLPAGDQIAAVIQESESEGGLEGTAPTEGRLAAPGLAIPPRPGAKLEGREAAVAAVLAGEAVALAGKSESDGTAAAPAGSAADSSAAAADEGVMVQLASLTSAEAAERSWQTMNARHAEQLAGLEHSVQKIEIEGRGTFYRLRAGPFADRDAALARCAALKDKGQACIVVAP